MSVILYVEGATDRSIAFMLLDRAGIPLDQVEILPRDGARGVVDAVRAASMTGGVVAALIDSDGVAPDAAVASFRKAVGKPGFPVFVAVPEIEYWVVGDETSSRALGAAGKATGESDGSVPLEMLASTIDVERAAAMNPSLRDFLAGMQTLVGAPEKDWANVPGRKVPRDIVAGLLREMSEDDVAWRLVDGTTFTTRQLISEVEEGSDLGRQYASDLLRVARDLIKRQASKRR